MIRCKSSLSIRWYARRSHIIGGPRRDLYRFDGRKITIVDTYGGYFAAGGASGKDADQISCSLCGFRSSIKQE